MSANPYAALIPAPNASKPNFMALVTATTGAFADITAVVQSLPAAFDLDNAVGVQLDAVGLWVGQSRIVPNVLNIQYFGFSELSNGSLDGDVGPFGELNQPNIGAPFYDLGDPLGSTTQLSDAQYRVILRAAIVRNTYQGDLAQLETALQFVFGSAVQVIDAGTMVLDLVVYAAQDAVIQALIANYDILPRPAGVRFGTIQYGLIISTESGQQITTEGGVPLSIG